jgi:hypothetical protein
LELRIPSLALRSELMGVDGSRIYRHMKALGISVRKEIALTG